MIKRFLVLLTILLLPYTAFAQINVEINLSTTFELKGINKRPTTGPGLSVFDSTGDKLYENRDSTITRYSVLFILTANKGDSAIVENYTYHFKGRETITYYLTTFKPKIIIEWY